MELDEAEAQRFCGPLLRRRSPDEDIGSEGRMHAARGETREESRRWLGGALRRRSVAVLVVALAAAAIPVALHLAVPTAAPGAALFPKQACGYDRWTVKTLQDRPQLLPTETSTVAALGSRTPPAMLFPTRLPQEHHVYVVTADVVAIQPQTDGDLHVILSAGGQTMISETPNPACTGHATPFRRLQMRQARESVRMCHAQVTGVFFFDYAAGQTGHARNYAELHPVLVFHCLPSLGATPSEHQNPLTGLPRGQSGD